jgi:hypothetical protein
MEILRIETELVAIDDSYYSTTITTNSGLFMGQGGTPELSLQDAEEALVTMTSEMTKALLSKHIARNGVLLNK